jgi:hypothetical protein
MKGLAVCGILSVVLSDFCTTQPTTCPGPHVKVAAPDRGIPYVLDRDTFAKELAAARSDDAKLEVLARRWEAVKLAIGYCNAASGPGEFHRSSAYWYSGWPRNLAIESKQDLDQPAHIDQGGAVVVRGDCLADITLDGNAFIHIYGDLQARIKTSAQCEIVIGGDIKPQAKIEDEGIAKIFVGGDVDGDLENRGSAFVWINSDLHGTVETGTPSIQLHIMGDFAGTMRPVNEAALAYLDVRGFMPNKKIEEITEHKYTEFEASIGISDQPPGLYPKASPLRHNGQWVVHAQRQTGQVADNAQPTPMPKQASDLGLAACEQTVAAATKRAATTQQAGEQDAEAESMLRLVEKRYRTAKTYRDEGLVRIKFTSDRRPFEDERPFSTAFERGGRFRWEYRGSIDPGGKPTQQYVVWSRDQKTFNSWWDVTHEQKQHDSIGMALAGPTGVSGGSAVAINALLRKIKCAKYTDLENPTVKGTETIQNVDCTIIEGRDRTGGPVRLWLDSSFAIRQIVTSHEIDQGKTPKHKGEPEADSRRKKLLTETTITIKPTFDAPIDDQEFEFEPPSHGKQ